MNYALANYPALIIVVLVCLGIFVGSLQSARAIMRRQQNIDAKNGAIEAKRNTMRGDLAALRLGINQVQGYIDELRADQSDEAKQICAEAQTGLDRAKALKQEVEDSLDKATSDTALQICALKLDQARFRVHHARTSIQNHTGADDQDQD